jgi:hypothetical protein
MPEEDDWLLRPVAKKLCSYESLKNGTLDILDIARLNDLLDVQAENQRRIDAKRVEK